MAAQPQPLLKPRSPKIDWGNSLTSGLVFDAPFFEGAGTSTEDDASPLGLEVVGSIIASGATWDKNFYGTDLDFSAAASEVLFSALPASTTTLVQFSLEFLVYYRSTGGGGLGRIAQKTNTATNGRWQLFTGSSASNQLALQLTTSGTAGLWRYNNFLPTNTWVHGIVCFDGSTITNTPTVYSNGLVVAATSSVGATGTWNADDSFLAIGNRNNAATRNWDGKISYFRMWNRIITSTEAKSLYTNPWQIYVKPNFLPYYISPAVVAAGTNQATLMMMGFGM